MAAVERDVTGAVVALADTLAADLSEDDFHEMVVTLCAELLQVSAAGLLLAGDAGTVRLAAAVPCGARAVELAQLDHADGPGLDCVGTGKRVHCADLTGADVRWRRFAPAARAAGFRSVHSIPLLLRGETLGAIDLFGVTAGSLAADAAALAQALAAITAVGLQYRRTISKHEVVIGQLQTALDSRILIEQAKGVLAERSHVSVDVAFAALRRQARCTGRKLVDVAFAVVDEGMTVAIRAERAER
jgi:hypothetical protein